MSQNEQPNILLLVTDHQLYYRHGWDSGVKPHTPTRDMLVSQGLSFNRSYAVSPLCSPARRSLLCGHYPHTHQNVFNQQQKPYLEKTYLTYLKEAGYENHVIGKWHAGPGDATDLGAKGFSLPGYGNPYTTKTYAEYCSNLGIEEAKHTVIKKFWNADTARHFPDLKEGNTHYQCKGSWCGETAFGITNTDKRSHECFFLASLAQETLKLLSRNESNPFHLRVDFWGPHQPYFPTQDYLDLYNPSDIKEYGSFRDSLEDKPQIYRNMNQPIADESGRLIVPSVFDWKTWQQLLQVAYAQTTMVDEAIGTILATLRETGLEENTMVILTSDHGDALASHGGMFDKGSFMTEETVRTPLIVRWPKQIAPNTQSKRLVSTLDIMPTILDCARIPIEKQLPGKSLLRVINRESLLIESYGQGYRDTKRSRTVVTQQYKYTRNEGDIDELYDLDRDPYECTNLSFNPSFSSLKSDLARCMEDHLVASADPDRLLFFPKEIP